MNNQKRRLGESVFIVLDDGSVIRTVVSELNRSEKGYMVLHDQNGRFQSFDFAEAEANAKKKLEGLEAELAEKLAAVRAKLAINDTPEHLQEVLDAPLAVRSTTGFLPDSTIEKLEIPANYWEPGQVVYGVITPRVHFSDRTMRVHSFFVLETEVVRVGIDKDGRLNYLYRGYCNLSQGVYANVDDAKRKLVEAFAVETGGVLPVEAVKLVTLAQAMRQEAVA